MLQIQIDLVDELIALGWSASVAREGVTGLSNVSREMIERTVSGMAHWAHTGPSGKTCGDCEFYVMLEHGLGQSPRCEKYHQMMNRWGSKRIDSMTPSCKYFEERKD